MRPIPIAEIFHDLQTGYFGYRYFFEGRPPHYALAAYPRLEATARWKSSGESWKGSWTGMQSYHEETVHGRLLIRKENGKWVRLEDGPQ